MPLYGGGNKNKRKGTRRGQGNAQKAGVKGIAAQYITRNKAIKKLQISLKDFRRLCILKGIYPRDPRKKKEGKDKTYYHVKDIAYLHHEPLLHQFRQLKIFLKKYKKALARHDRTKAKILEETTKPVITLHHLIRERYPTFVDALRDLDDPLSLLALFASLPSDVVEGATGHSSEKAAECQTLLTEWQRWIAEQHALRKVFVSIKGVYFQARIQGVDITWLEPHPFKQHTPVDVDYRVMMTFLQFYLELMRFVNFKVYHDAGLQYPPVVDVSAEERRAGVRSLHLQSKVLNASVANGSGSNASSSSTSSSSTASAPTVGRAAKKQLQKSVAQVLNKLKQRADDDDDAGEEMDTNEDGATDKDGGGAGLDADADPDVDEDGDDAAAFAKLAGGDDSNASLSTNNLSPAELDALHAAQVFKGLTFLLGREIASTALEFVILAGGGKVEHERDVVLRQEAKKKQASSKDGKKKVAGAAADKDDDDLGILSPRFTHQVVDRPSISGERLKTREYIQPQWIFDSFNCYTCLPVGPYAPGITPPPHLSPFVKSEESGEIESLPPEARAGVYIPRQREVLQKWGAKASWLAKPTSMNDAAAEQGQEEEEEDALMDEEERADREVEQLEAQHLQELERERSGFTHSQHVAAAEKEEKQQEQEQKQKSNRKKALKRKQQEDAEEEQEDEDEEDDEEADDSEDEMEADSADENEDEESEEEEEEEEEAEAPARKTSRRDQNHPQELAKAMMTKKNKRLHSRMMYGIERKKEEAANLDAKRRALEKQEEKQQQKKKRRTSTK